MKQWHQRVSILVWVVEIWRRSLALSLGVSVPPRFACLTLNDKLKIMTAWQVSHTESWLCRSLAKPEISWIIALFIFLNTGIIIEGAAILFLPTVRLSKIQLTHIFNSCSIIVIWWTVTTLSKHSLLNLERCKQDALRQVHGWCIQSFRISQEEWCFNGVFALPVVQHPVQPSSETAQSIA